MVLGAANNSAHQCRGEGRTAGSPSIGLTNTVEGVRVMNTEQQAASGIEAGLSVLVATFNTVHQPLWYSGFESVDSRVNKIGTFLTSSQL
jgi:hypothetical protein